jgi:hypothetical protein
MSVKGRVSLTHFTMHFCSCKSRCAQGTKSTQTACIQETRHSV